MKQGTLLAVLGSLASVQVSAIPQPNAIWERLGDYVEQKRQASVVSYGNSNPAPTSLSSDSPSAITAITTLIGVSVDALPTTGPVTTAGAGLSTVYYTSDTTSTLTRTSDDDTCVIYAPTRTVFASIIGNVTEIVTASSSSALYGNATSSTITTLLPSFNATSTPEPTGLFPTFNGTSSQVGPSSTSVFIDSTITEPTPSSTGVFVNSTTADSTTAEPTSSSTGVSSDADLPSSTGVFVNSTTEPTPSSTGVFANSTTAEPTPSSTGASSDADSTTSETTSSSTGVSSDAVLPSSTSVFIDSTTTEPTPSSTGVSSDLVLPSSTDVFVSSTTAESLPSSTGVFVNSTSADPTVLPTSLFTSAEPTPESSSVALTTLASDTTTASTSVAEPSISSAAVLPTLSSSDITVPTSVPTSVPGSDGGDGDDDVTLTETETTTVTAGAGGTGATTETATETFISAVPTRASASASAILTSSFTTFTRPPPVSQPPTAPSVSPAVSVSSESLIIATTISASITAPQISAPISSSSIPITRTITGGGLGHHGHHGHGPHPTGTPSDAEAYCGVHGTAQGVDYLGTFVENAQNVPVTLRGCYQFCRIYSRGGGCKSFHFHEKAGLRGSAACDLYSGPTNVVISVLDDSAGVWFDIGCPAPGF